MSFSSNLATWLGAAPNALQSGRVDCYVGANNDKTGYSLTAGSYSVRASSSQRAAFTISDTTSSQTSAVSSVTTTRAFLGWTGGSYNTTATDPQDYMGRITLTNATTVTGTRNDVSGNLVLSFELQELY